jgi:hypothetical protein
MRGLRSLGRLAFAVVACSAVPAPAAAQASASAAASALGDNYTALARSFNAAAWNPANLGLPGNARFSLAISPQLGLGTGPVTLSDVHGYGGKLVPDPVRHAWLQRIGDAGGQDIGGTVDITPLALSIGPVALSATTTLRADGTVPEAVAELLLFGNAGRMGVPQDYVLTDLGLDANATTTFAAAYGHRLSGLIGDFALGLTGKYIVGHGMASLRDNGSSITSDPLALHVDAPMVLTDTATLRNGAGFGLDIGAAWTLGKFRTGAVVRNAVNTFRWDTDRLYYVPLRATIDGAVQEADGAGEILPISAASPELRAQLVERVGNVTVPPTLALGVAYTGLRRVTFSVDLRQRLGAGLELGSRTHAGVGAELHLIPFVPLRAGVTTLGNGMRYSGGLGLEFGVVNLQASASLREVNGRSDTGGGLTLSFGGR